MRVVVDVVQCEGNAVCVGVAPGLFELPDNEIARVLVDPVPSDAEARARDAVRLCPKQALSIEEDE